MVNAECLPTEIWLEVFSYLAADHNTKAFSNLNRFFDRFASTKYFAVHRRLERYECVRNPSKAFIENLRLETIWSLSAGHRNHYRLIEFVYWYSDALINLRKLSVYLRKETMMKTSDYLIDALERLSSLKSLEIRSDVPNLDDSRMRNLFIVIFSNRLALTHCQLLFFFERFNLRQIQWSGPSSIQYLTLREISWSNLRLILNQTPNLVALEVSCVGSPFEPLTLVFPSLRKVQLTIDQMPFAVLAEIRRSAPHLNFFVVQGSFLNTDPDYFQEDLWRKLLHGISLYDISLENCIQNQNYSELLKRIYARLVRKKWLNLLFDHSGSRVKIFFCRNESSA